MTHNYVDACYEQLRARIREEEDKPGATKLIVIATVQGNNEIDWAAIKAVEELRSDWDKISRHWKRVIISEYIESRNFTWGGDRTSAKYRGRMQQALVSRVEQHAQAAKTQQVQDENQVADTCIDDVTQRWRAATEDGMCTIRRVVRTVVHRVWTDNRDNTVDETFDRLELREVCTAEAKEAAVPTVAGIPWDTIGKMAAHHA